MVYAHKNGDRRTCGAFSRRSWRTGSSPLEVLLQGHVGADEVGAADGRGVVVDDVTQRKVDVRLDVLLVRRSRDTAAIIVVVVAWHADLRLGPPDGVAVAGEQLHHLMFKSGASR